MKKSYRSLLFLLALIPSFTSAQLAPLITSWVTEGSGSYARIYETAAAETAGNSVTTWNRGAGVQAQPTYGGVSEVSYTATDVYVRSSGLGIHVMGPWYLNAQRTNLFPNYPSRRSVLYRIPRDPGTPPVTKVDTGLGSIGYFVDGVSMFDSRDAFSYSTANGADATPMTAFRGDDVWNRDAFVNESITFDAGNAHQAGNNYHYHANPPGLRHVLGDSVEYDAVANQYTEVFNGMHSPILGWVEDGYPVYGPYGYDDPTVGSASQVVRRMGTGYQKRDGTNGSVNLNVTGRTTLPQWVNTFAGTPTALAANRFGPVVSGAHTLGHYLEDYAYLGDLGFTFGVDFDLDAHNGRFCRTPEFPQGTYAYFVSVAADGTPVFPYNIGRYYYGNPSSGNVATVPAGAVTYAKGGPEAPASLELIADDPGPGDITVQWSGVEGGSYQVDRSENLRQWQVLAQGVNAPGGVGDVADPQAMAARYQAYRNRLTGVAPFDDAGFNFVPPVDPFTTLTISLSGGAPSDLSVGPTSLLFNGQPVVYLDRPGQHEIRFQVMLDGLPQGDYTIEATFPGVAGPQTGSYNVIGNPNILLLIVDDWAVDSSPLDNPGGRVANMPTLASLAASGVRFTQAYAQPVCSPTRATIITGRHPFRHGVGNPTTDNALDASELTLPEVFTLAGAPHAMGSFGKWHLGGGANGPSVIGGWDKFAGILQGGVQDYFDWTKNEDGNNTQNFTTYTTSDQVNEAVEYIGLQGTNSWFVWMGFNAPHDPFHVPPIGLAPPGGYSTQAVGESTNEYNYRLMLEALDTEIGRLLASVDLSRTDVILLGDNGTPGQVVQAPFSNNHAKSSLYQGGTHVPMVMSGPSVTLPPNSTSDTLVHCIDLFSTILEIAGIDEAATIPGGTTIDSTSILPILQGNDNGDRCVVVEKFGDTGGNGRGIILDDYPDYKLIVFGDKDSTIDVPTFEFYNITTDVNEQTPLAPSANQAAYDALIAKDAALGGGYSDQPTGPMDIIYIELFDPAGPPPIPTLQNPNGNPINPTSITIDGVAGAFIERVNQGADLSDEGDDMPDVDWVKVRMSPPNGPYTSATVNFTIQGNPRSFDSQQIVVKP